MCSIISTIPKATEIENRTISTDIEKLRTMKNVVGVAGGSEKIAAIKAVLRGGYLNVLVTDSKTAEGLLLSSAFSSHSSDL